MITIRNWDEAYLNELIKSGEKESLTLEYKSSSSLKNQDKEKNERAKDVSAFANSAGGVILYGILEDKHASFSR
jgi:predicted HTH transcriptional regulator